MLSELIKIQMKRLEPQIRLFSKGRHNGFRYPKHILEEMMRIQQNLDKLKVEALMYEQEALDKRITGTDAMHETDTESRGMSIVAMNNAKPGR